MRVNKDMSLYDLISTYPETKDVLKNNGINGLDNKEILEKLKEITIEKAMELKKINVDTFMELLEESIKIKRDVSDITMEDRKVKKDGLSLTGLLPCPVRLPLLEKLKEFLDSNADISINYELKAASSGLSWLKDDVIKANNIDNLSDMFISAGFDLFFEKDLMGKFKEEGVFKDITDIKEYNEDFKELKDPKGEYSMIGVVPAIFLVNKEKLGDRKIPKSWEDILSPDFEKSVALPIADFDLFNAILVNIYKKFGEEGVEKLGKSLVANMHPAEMVGSNGPTVTIMPYFFSKMIKENGPMIPVWPKEGAIISPIFMLTKKNKEKKLKKIAQFMSGKEVGEILSHQGLFPSVNPKVENKIDGKATMWIGWDYIYSNDIGKIIRNCEEIFKKGADL